MLGHTASDFFKQVRSELFVEAEVFERRSEDRQRLVIPVMVTPFDSEWRPAGDMFHAVTRDMSASGIGLIATRSVHSPFFGLLTRSLTSCEDMLVIVQPTRCRHVGFYYDIGGKIIEATRTRTG